MRHRQTKGPETDRRLLNHRATSRLSIWDGILRSCHKFMGVEAITTYSTQFLREAPHILR